MWRALAASLAGLAALVGCAKAESPAVEGTLPPEISALEAHARMGQGAVLIDVRTPSEWKQSGVAESAWRVALGDPDFTAKVATILGGDTSAEVAFICRSGNRSKTARDRLIAAGYPNATSVAGGTLRGGGWTESGLAVVAITDVACEQPAGQC